MQKLSEPTNEASNTATSFQKDGSTKNLKKLNLLASPSGSKKVTLRRLPRKDAALLRFLKGTGISPSQVETAPNLTAIIGKRTSVIESMRFSQEPSVVGFLKVYDQTPVCDRKQISFEAVALKAGCNFNELLGAIILSFRSVQAQRSAIIAMEHHPNVVEATVGYAMTEDGFKDRRMLHEAVGFVPTPKGASINVNFPGVATANSGDDDAAATEPEIDNVFPRITNKLEKWQADRSRMLEGEN
jgi:hypothetical protein